MRNTDKEKAYLNIANQTQTINSNPATILLISLEQALYSEREELKNKYDQHKMDETTYKDLISKLDVKHTVVDLIKYYYYTLKLDYIPSDLKVRLCLDLNNKIIDL